MPGCFSQGETIEQTLSNIKEAIELHIEGPKERGERFQKIRALWWGESASLFFLKGKILGLHAGVLCPFTSPSLYIPLPSGERIEVRGKDASFNIRHPSRQTPVWAFNPLTLLQRWAEIPATPPSVTAKSP